jgi:hypothetical protein
MYKVTTSFIITQFTLIIRQHIVLVPGEVIPEACMKTLQMWAKRPKLCDKYAVIGLTADTLSYVMTTENRAFIEKTSASDPDKTFSINWIAYTLQLMLGAEHYGLQVGEIFHGDKRATEGGIHTRLQIARVQCFNPRSPHGWDSRFSERWKWRRVHVVLQVLFARAAR